MLPIAVVSLVLYCILLVYASIKVFRALSFFRHVKFVRAFEVKLRAFVVVYSLFKIVYYSLRTEGQIKQSALIFRHCVYWLSYLCLFSTFTYLTLFLAELQWTQSSSRVRKISSFSCRWYWGINIGIAIFLLCVTLITYLLGKISPIGVSISMLGMALADMILTCGTFYYGFLLWQILRGAPNCILTSVAGRTVSPCKFGTSLLIMVIGNAIRAVSTGLRGFDQLLGFIPGDDFFLPTEEGYPYIGYTDMAAFLMSTMTDFIPAFIACTFWIPSRNWSLMKRDIFSFGNFSASEKSWPILSKNNVSQLHSSPLQSSLRKLSFSDSDIRYPTNVSTNSIYSLTDDGNYIT